MLHALMHFAAKVLADFAELATGSCLYCGADIYCSAFSRKLNTWIHTKTEIREDTACDI